MEEPDSPESLFTNESKFYENAELYWSQVPPTIDGMLGGHGCVSNTDIRGSELFLKKLFNLRDHPGNKKALDCGAGIGRVTKNLLVKYFEKVDLVEQNPKFLEAAKKFLTLERKVGDFYNSGLQNFVPKSNYYDIIWCQWVLGHLTDKDFVTFLINCKSGLRKNGLIVIKENVCTEGIVPDEEDSSVTRSVDGFMTLFRKADFDIVRHCKQPNFPKQLFGVKLFALKPKLPLDNIDNVIQDVENGRKEVDVKEDVENGKEVNENGKEDLENISELPVNCTVACDIAEQLITTVIIKDKDENGS